MPLTGAKLRSALRVAFGYAPRAIPPRRGPQALKRAIRPPRTRAELDSDPGSLSLAPTTPRTLSTHEQGHRGSEPKRRRR